MGEQTGVTTRLRRLWIMGSALVAIAVVPSPLSVAGYVAGPVLAVACGVTAARGPAVGTGLRVIAWFLAVLPPVVVAVAVTVMWFSRAGLLEIVLVAFVGGGVAVCLLVVFCVAYIAETLRLGHAARARGSGARLVAGSVRPDVRGRMTRHRRRTPESSP